MIDDDLFAYHAFLHISGRGSSYITSSMTFSMIDRRSPRPGLFFIASLAMPRIAPSVKVSFTFSS